MAKMKIPALRVQLESDGETTEYEIQPDYRDMVRFDMIRARKGFPPATEAPFVMQGVLAWSALTREGATRMTVEQALEAIVALEEVDEEGPGEVDPT